MSQAGIVRIGALDVRSTSEPRIIRWTLITIALASDTLSLGQVYDAADTVLAQRLSQVAGVSRVQIEGGQTPAVRIQLDPGALRAAGISAQDVAAAIRNANVLQPTGNFQGANRAQEIMVNGQISRAAEYGRLVLKVHNGAVLRLSDVATVIDSVSNTRLAAWHNRQPAILLAVSKVAGANVIQTVDRVRAALPQLAKWISPEIKITILDDRTASIRASTNDVQITLLITGALVLMTVLLFLRRTAATFCGTCSRARTQPNRLAPATMSPTTAAVLTDSLKTRGRSRHDSSREMNRPSASE